MKSQTPKVLHQVGGRAMLDWALDLAEQLGCARVVVVAGAHAPQVGAHGAARLGAEAVATQAPLLGTAHAVLAARAALEGFVGDMAVLYADTPLIRHDTIERLFAMRAARGGVAVLGFEARDPSGYGRLIRSADGSLARIVEHADADESERAVRLCNSGVMVADKDELFGLLASVKNDNAKGEYYLTDVVRLAREAGSTAHVVVGDEGEMMGVNSRAELAQAEAAFQARARRAALESGVTMHDPNTVYFSYDTKLAPDVVIEPNVFFGPGVTVESGAHIHAFCHFERAEIGPGAMIGPFARFRPGAKLGRKVKIGNFVEVKNATFHEGAKASHLTYIVDAEVGARANLGCGTITCNYDGYTKHRTIIGEDAFIGSDTSLVAPVTVGARAYTASGSVITHDVPEGALAVARGRQRDIEGWADAFRDKMLAAKAEKP